MLNVTESTVEKMTLTLRGRAVTGKCLVDPVAGLDFGAVAKGTSFIKRVKVSNTSDIDWNITVGKIVPAIPGVDEGVYSFADGFGPGDYKVPSHGELFVPIQFSPTHDGAHNGFLQILQPEVCGAPMLPLLGQGVDQVLDCEPKEALKDSTGKVTGYVCRLNFGYINPNTKKTAAVTFKDLGNQDLTVSDLSIDTTGPFTLDNPPASIPLTANGGTGSVNVTFAPTVLGKFKANLKFKSNDPKRAGDSVELVGVGGGPKIDVLPKSVDFGPVASSTYQYRRITIANIGTDVAGTTDDNLFLGSFDNGVYTEKQAELITNYPNDFTLEWPPRGYSSAGIAAGSNVDLRIKFTPTGPGAKDALVRIYSNDLDQPVIEVPIVAEGRDMPPCDYSVIPGQLNFGNVDPGKGLQQSFFIRNNSSDPANVCLVSTLGFSYGTPRAFTLPKGSMTGEYIKGGDQLEVPVLFAPTAAIPYSGAVEFYISSQNRPMSSVALAGSALQAGIMVAPNDLDFGVIQIGCSSRERTFTIYNISSGNLDISGITIEDQNNEFHVTQQPVLPHRVAAGAQVEFKVAYKPVDIGPDRGLIRIQTTDPNKSAGALGYQLEYLVTLSGRGDLVAIQTDTFAQDPQPKVDVLFVVDNSGSMDDKQTSLGTNFGNFIQFADSQRIDYHIAVTTTSVDPTDSSYENGSFVPMPGAASPNPRVITRKTPNAAQVFKDNVKVGTNGSGTEMLLEPGYLALSPPLINTNNAGFLRDEAYLAIVVVSDAEDQSNQTVAFYQSFFMNIKGFRRANMFSLSGIIPTLASAPAGCSYDPDVTGTSTRVKDIVAATGGVYDEICTSNWAKALEKLGQTAFGYRTRFFLTNPPDIDPTKSLDASIQVLVDGLPYPSVGSQGEVNWTYNSQAQAIDFDPMAVPQPGQTLTVTYHVACL